MTQFPMFENLEIGYCLPAIGGSASGGKIAN